MEQSPSRLSSGVLEAVGQFAAVKWAMGKMSPAAIGYARVPQMRFSKAL